MNPFKQFPLTTLILWASTMLAVLVVLQTSGILTGTAAQWVNFAAGALQVVLTAYARLQVTPVVDPKDNLGRALVPANIVPPAK